MVLPIPSEPVMVAYETLFGVVAAALLSIAGSVGSALVAFAIGRTGTAADHVSRLIHTGELVP